jgi:hypothetical protein
MSRRRLQISKGKGKEYGEQVETKKGRNRRIIIKQDGEKKE